ncbi:MAG: large subunit ribosomal protein L4 [Microgenomates group bacterium Gr01-1014_93]|nr:MAG: large subunit ribosomal protein L4 [Microgenomates group bacterium Gr01-1014_93]
MPRVKKLKTIKQKTVIASAAKQSSSDKPQTKIATKPSASRNDKFSVPVYSLAGRAAGTMALPKEIFGVDVNKVLLSQAMRVYMTNQTGHFGSTKGRGEVRASGAKIYKQKGTGRARHGAISAPIFVGGGIAFGPKIRKTRLDLPKKMKKAALLSALSSKMGEKEILGVTGLEKATGKTKEMVKLLGQLIKKKQETSDKLVSALIITENKQENMVRAVRNIPKVDILPVNQINAYEILKHKFIFLTKGTVEKLK